MSVDTQAPTVDFSNTLNRGHDDSDVNYLTAALSFYLGGPAGEDVTSSWGRILDRLGIPKETEQHTRAPDPAVAALEAEVARLRKACRRVAACLTAAIWLLKNGGKKAAASDKMFEISLADYERSLDVARSALNPAPSEKEAG